MSVGRNSGSGIEKLIEKYKKDFRIPENLKHYSSEDYSRVEKYYVTYCLKNGCFKSLQPHGGHTGE